LTFYHNTISAPNKDAAKAVDFAELELIISDSIVASSFGGFAAVSAGGAAASTSSTVTVGTASTGATIPPTVDDGREERANDMDISASAKGMDILPSNFRRMRGCSMATLRVRRGTDES
jgi:hypothetical protein